MATKVNWTAIKTLALLGGAGLGSLTRPRARRVVASRGGYRRIATRYRRRGRKMSKRQWQAKARRQVGAPRNYSSAKTAIGYQATNLTKLNQQLHVATCIRIGKGTEINERLRDTCVVSGCRIQFNVRNQNGFACYVNWAVIHPKQVATPNSTTADFFRAYGSERSWAANAANKNGQEWCNAAINSDDYAVLRRGKYLLAPIPNSVGILSNTNVKDNEKCLDIYVKLGRSVYFPTDDAAQEPYEQLYFVWWMAGPLQANGLGTADGMLENTKIITYFREPKSG